VKKPTEEGAMDDFEQELSRLMRESRQDRPFEERHRRRLHTGVRARQRARTAWIAATSALAVGGAGAGLVILANSLAQGAPATPTPRPVVSAETAPALPTARRTPTAERGPEPPRTPAAGPASPACCLLPTGGLGT
jgi:hypothetical protein